MRVVVFSDDDFNIWLTQAIFRMASDPNAFVLSFVRDTVEMLEETDFEDLSTAIFIDMKHLQAKFVIRELDRGGIWRNLIPVTICRTSMMQEDIAFTFGRGISFQFVSKLTSPHELLDFLQNLSAERGLK